MRKAKLTEDYSKMLKDAVSPYAHSVIRQMATSTFIPDGVKITTRLSEALLELDREIASVDYPTPAQTAQRDLLRTAVMMELGRVAKVLNLDYLGNEPALLSSGLRLVDTLASTTASRATIEAEAVLEIELFDGSQPGCVLVKMKRHKSMKQNLLRYTVDASLPEEHWAVAVGGGRERQLGPFPSRSVLLVKGAGLTASTTEPVYSAVKTRVVQ